MRRKINNVIDYKDIFNLSPHCIYGNSFEWFSVGDNELVCGQPLMLVTPEIYSSRHAITHNVLST